MTGEERAHRIGALTEELENLKRSLPAHSLKPALLIRIEELEEQIEALRRADGPYEALRREALARFTFLE